MARYRMSDGVVVDTDKATRAWEEARDWNGQNWISRNTRSQWTHETLYRSRKGRYYLVYSSQWQGSTPSAEWVSEKEALKWLILNDKDLPAELEALAEQITE